LEENDQNLVDDLDVFLTKLWGPLKANRYLDIKKVDRRLTKVSAEDHLAIDVGAGLCLDSIRLAKVSRVFCIAVDLQRSALTQGRSWATELGVSKKLDFVVASALDLPFRNSRADLTVSYSAIDHLPSRESVQRWFDEMSRITRPGGGVVLTTSNRLWLFYPAFQLACHVLPGFRKELFFRPSELVVMMTKAGLRPKAFDGRGLYYPYTRKGFVHISLFMGKLINSFQDLSIFKVLCGRIGFRATK